MELFGRLWPWSCSCRCATTRCESSLEDELPIRFVEDLEELTNVDVFLEKVDCAVKRCSLPPGAQRTVIVVGDGSHTGTLCNLIAGKDSFESQRLVNHWESVDGAISILKMNLAKLADLEVNDQISRSPHSEAVAQAAREALADLLLWAHRGINVLLYVVPFGPVSEERIRRLIFLTQYLLGNELLLHLYVVVTDVPSSLHGTSEWISAFADSDFGFRHLYTLAGKNPSRFVTLRKHQAENIGQDLSVRKALLSVCGRHPVHMMPSFGMKQMQEVLSEIQEERSKLDELQSKVRKLQNELQRLPNGSPHGKESPAINQKQALPVISGGDLNAKVDTSPPRYLWRRLEKAEEDVVAAQALMERKLHEVKAESSFQQQVDDLALSALRRFWTDLEVSDASKGSFANHSLEMSDALDAFGKGRVMGLGREVPARFQVFLSMSASCAMTNSEDRPPTVIFDWDDTLCPTTWMRQFAETGMDRMKLQLHSGRIEQVLRAARSFGYVDIVTMANRQWLDQTIGLLKSDLDLWKLFDELGIEVHYAQPSPSRVLKGDAREGISAKKVAMSAVLDKYYGDSVKARVHVLSIGDQDAEAVALQEVLQAAQGVSWFRPICKVLRLPSEPDLEELRGSLRKILSNLPALLRTESDLDLHVSSLDAR